MSPLVSNENFSMTCQIAGENALILYFTTSKDALLVQQIAAVQQAIADKLGTMIIDMIPSYASLLVVFDVFQADFRRVRQQIKFAASDVASLAVVAGKVIKLPVYYDESVGVDLQRIAQHANLTVEQVISIHQSQTYQVSAIGFAPGFAYLGDVDERIAMPRLATPRTKVPKGAVAIADRQTAIYPAESPGGWNIIGLSPSVLFDPNSTPHMPFKVGDSVVFEAINKETYLQLGGKL